MKSAAYSRHGRIWLCRCIFPLCDYAGLKGADSLTMCSQGSRLLPFNNSHSVHIRQTYFCRAESHHCIPYFDMALAMLGHYTPKMKTSHLVMLEFAKRPIHYSHVIKHEKPHPYQKQVSELLYHFSKASLTLGKGWHITLQLCVCYLSLIVSPLLWSKSWGYANACVQKAM